MENKDHRMSVRQAAEFIGVHTNTIYEWIREGKLRADKEGKSYKINHMDAYKIYASKMRVDEDKETIISIQKVKDELKTILTIKSARLLSNMENWVRESIELYDEHWERVNRFEENEHDYIKRCNYDIESMERLRNEKIDILIRARKEIESFYRAVDTIENLNQLYKYKESKRKTLDEELKWEKAFASGNITFTINKVTDEDRLFMKGSE